MKFVVPHEIVVAILRWTYRVLFAISVSMIGYCIFVLTDAWIVQTLERRDFDSMLGKTQAANTAEPRTTSTTAPLNGTPRATASPVGRIDIPRLQLSVMIMEGTDTKTLRRAVGHIPGTALPGQIGNVAISGHRDTFFRPLRAIQKNDVITLTTLLGEYRYRVVSMKVVDPQDITVLNSSGEQILTLITCYPFYFIGPAPDRFIVRAKRVEDGL